MKITNIYDAEDYLRRRFENENTAADLPTIRGRLPARHNLFRFAVEWPSGLRTITGVGPRGGLFVLASFAPDDWRNLQRLWP